MTEVIDNFFGLEFAIDGLDDTSMSNGENAFIIYLKVDNKTQKSRKINLSKATYVTSQREQLEQDIWLSGYILGEDTLKPDSFKKAGHVFYKSKLKKISENDTIYISIGLTQEGVELNLSFKKTGNNWILVSKEKTDIDIKLSPKQLGKNLLKRVERLESFEDKLGVYFDKLSLKIEDDFAFAILGEVHSKNGTSIGDSFEVTCVLYDIEDSILEQKTKYILKDNFLGFEIFEINFYRDGIANEVSKIRIYPKK